jgi:serine/threonine protein kinase
VHAFWDPQMLIGHKIDGRFKLLQLLARGGMGVVFRAVDVVEDAPRAVKVLNPQAAVEPDMLARIAAEAEALRGIDHPNVVRIYANGVEPGLSPWIAMELVEGENLAVRLLRSRARGERAISTEEVLEIGIDITLALQVVHGIGLLHRDVKPGNIVTERSTRRSKLVDFGISKRVRGSEPCPLAITRPGDFIGTTDYAAPEQWTGEAVARSDVYSLALTLAEALGGEARFGLHGDQRGWPIILRPLIVRREPERLISLLAASLSDRPELRPTAASMRAELAAILADKSELGRASVTRAERGRSGGDPSLGPRVDPDRETRPPLPDTIADPKTRRVDGEDDKETLSPRDPVSWFDPSSDPGASGRVSRGAPVLRLVPRGAEGRRRFSFARASVRAIVAAAVVAILGGAGWAFGGERASAVWSSAKGTVAGLTASFSSISPFSAPAGGEPPPQPFRSSNLEGERQARVVKVVRAKTAIGELASALARDVRAPAKERDRFLRYDCARMMRLAVDIDGVEHPAANEGRERLRAIASKYGERCERVLARARRAQGEEGR